jgi:hypothetical protein
MKKQNGPKRHHYVPVFYQKGFIETNERLWLYDRRTQRFSQTHPVNICCENDLYTVDPKHSKNRIL